MMALASPRDVAATRPTARGMIVDLGGGSVSRTHIAVLGTGAPAGRDERPCRPSRRTSSITVDHRASRHRGQRGPRRVAESAAMTTPNVRVIVTDEGRCALPRDTQAVKAALST